LADHSAEILGLEGRQVNEGEEVGGFSEPRLAKNLRILSTSTPARRSRVEQTVLRRRTCDKGIWTKPLAFAADAGLAMGFQSIYAWKPLPEAGFAEKSSYGSSFHERFA
jgi:hypothetical protein